MSLILEKREEDEVGVNLGFEEPSFCLENGMRITPKTYEGKASISLGAVKLVKDAP